LEKPLKKRRELSDFYDDDGKLVYIIKDDFYDEEANKEVENFIRGKLPLVRLNSDDFRSDNFYINDLEFPNDRKAITFLFKDTREWFERYIKALRFKKDKLIQIQTELNKSVGTQTDLTMEQITRMETLIEFLTKK
jgi:hypothetical protein